MAAAQYNLIGSDYAAMEDLPTEIVTTNLLRSKLQQLPQGLRVLDLACGIGTYARLALDLGVASHVTGVDISAEMVRVGRELEQKQSQHLPRIEYHVGDCAAPLDHLGLEPASFDLVMANYLFNYSTTRQELVSMWRNVVTYLKSGGTFVGLIPTFDVKKHIERSNWSGVTYTHVQDLDESVKVHLTFHCKPQVQFDNHVLHHAISYEEVPFESGMTDVVFCDPTEEHLPWLEDPTEFRRYKEYLRNPVTVVCVASKPK